MTREQILSELQRRGVQAPMVTPNVNKQAIMQELQRRGASIPSPVPAPVVKAPVKQKAPPATLAERIASALVKSQQARQESPVPIEALPMGLQDISLQAGEAVPTESIIQQAVEAGAPIAPEMAGGIAGGIKGQKLGRAVAGPFGGVVGGALGGIAGSALGKQTAAGLGLAPEQTVAGSLGEATKEEAIGRAITSGLGVAGKVAAPVIRPITKKVQNLLTKSGLAEPSIKTEDLFINSSTFDPNIKNPRNIIEAQENLFNERLLTTFEETGGKVDALRAQKLNDAVVESRRVSNAESAFLKNREIINNRLQKSLLPETSSTRLDSVLGDSIKNSFNTKLKSFSPRFKELQQQIVPLRKKVSYNVGDTVDKIKGVEDFVRDSLSGKEADILLETVSDRLSKNTITAADLRVLDNDIESLLPKFSESKDVQSKIAGVYSGHIKPILQEMKADNIRVNPTDDMMKLQALETDFARLAEEKGRLVNSKVANAIGLAEGKQIKKAISPKRMANVIFESPETWEQAKVILNDVNPELIPALGNTYKAKVVQDIFKEGDISTSKISNLLRDQSDIIKEVGGENYLKNLQDAQQIASALERTKMIGTGRVNLNVEDKIAENAKRFLIHPLAGRIGFFGGIMAKGKKVLGMGRVGDQDIFKAMQGKRGQEIVDNMTQTFMDNPDAYNLYVQFVREVKRINDNADPIGRDEFDAEMGSTIGELINNLNLGGQ
jgi:hypothetical protein